MNVDEQDEARRRLAAEYGLPTEWDSRLNGRDEAELRRDAESVRDLLKPREEVDERSTVDQLRDALGESESVANRLQHHLTTYQMSADSSRRSN